MNWYCYRMKGLVVNTILLKITQSNSVSLPTNDDDGWMNAVLKTPPSQIETSKTKDSRMITWQLDWEREMYANVLSLHSIENIHNTTLAIPLHNRK